VGGKRSSRVIEQVRSVHPRTDDYIPTICCRRRIDPHLRKQYLEIMRKSVLKQKADLLVAIAHPNRIRILEQLRNEIKCNCELAPALGLEQSNLSRHLKVLTQAGVLISWKDGLRVNFKIADERFFELLDLAENIAAKSEHADEPGEAGRG
jgi:DNA-binding transcriptional ArsR family regulator